MFPSLVLLFIFTLLLKSTSAEVDNKEVIEKFGAILKQSALVTGGKNTISKGKTPIIEKNLPRFETSKEKSSRCNISMMQYLLALSNMELWALRGTCRSCLKVIYLIDGNFSVRCKW